MDIIRELRRGKGMTQREVAQRLGVHQTAVSQWENGRTTPDRESCAALAALFGVSVGSLLGLEDGARERHFVPVLGYVRAGIPLEAVEDILDYEEITEKMAMNGEHFGLRIVGDSMLPRFVPGDVVIVRRQSDVESGSIAVVLINGMDATVKKVIKRGTSLVLMPLNSAYEPMIFSRKEICDKPVLIVGKVVELRGKFA